MEGGYIMRAEGDRGPFRHVRTQEEGANQERDSHLTLLTTWSLTSWPPEQLEINVCCLHATHAVEFHSNLNGLGLVLSKHPLPCYHHRSYHF